MSAGETREIIKHGRETIRAVPLSTLHRGYENDLSLAQAKSAFATITRLLMHIANVKLPEACEMVSDAEDKAREGAETLAAAAEGADNVDAIYMVAAAKIVHEKTIQVDVGTAVMRGTMEKILTGMSEVAKLVVEYEKGQKAMLDHLNQGVGAQHTASQQADRYMGTL